MAEAVVVVAPARRSQQEIQRRNRLAPGKLDGFFQPFGVLDRHRSRHHRECFIGYEEAVPPGQDVPFPGPARWARKSCSNSDGGSAARRQMTLAPVS